MFCDGPIGLWERETYNATADAGLLLLRAGTSVTVGRGVAPTGNVALDLVSDSQNGHDGGLRGWMKNEGIRMCVS